MGMDKENDSINTSVPSFALSSSQLTSPGASGHLKHTPIRPLTAAYMAARSENEVCCGDFVTLAFLVADF